MQDYPHQYVVEATAGDQGDVIVSSDRLPDLVTSSPPQFGGPDDRWSPETLVVASVADCFILTFRAIARASRLSWKSLKCEAMGRLEKLDGVTRFTEFQLHAYLSVPADTPVDRSERLLQKAEEVCLITRSMTSQTHLKTSVNVGAGGVEAV